MRSLFFTLLLLVVGVSLSAQRTSLKINESTKNDQYEFTVRATDNYASELKAAFLEVAGPAYGKQTGGILVFSAEEGLTMQLDVRRNRLSIEQTAVTAAATAKAKAWGRMIKERLKKDAPTPPPPPATPHQ
ncbi:hypothetical protein [Lewinella sp. W8]|uniref:hypothetical protein n=1 Tax=Lewinella sp. W8 TaxID=2528208 RepID=UPI0010674659|nr:hypothetical protein [Lewinella sp. W8]MTB53649.1 hypothetical protein [Lewinella sp. W8]